MKDYDLLEEYQSHKIVKAGKIAGIEFMKDGSAVIALAKAIDPTRTVLTDPSTIKTGTGYRERFKGDENELGYYVRYKDGYENWSPTKAFEEGYSPVAEKSENQGPSKTSNLHFGEALECLKAGLKVSRTGWNGKGMYAVMMPGCPDGVPVNETTQRAHGVPKGTVLKYRPYFQLLTEQGDVAMWSPSGSDILAEDWMVLN